MTDEPIDFKGLEQEVDYLIKGGVDKDCKKGLVICNLDGKKCDHHYSGGWKWWHKWNPLAEAIDFIPVHTLWRCRHSPKGDPTKYKGRYYPNDFMLRCSEMRDGAPQIIIKKRG